MFFIFLFFLTSISKLSNERGYFKKNLNECILISQCLLFLKWAFKLILLKFKFRNFVFFLLEILNLFEIPKVVISIKIISTNRSFHFLPRSIDKLSFFLIQKLNRIFFNLKYLAC